MRFNCQDVGPDRPSVRFFRGLPQSVSVFHSCESVAKNFQIVHFPQKLQFKSIRSDFDYIAPPSQTRR